MSFRRPAKAGVRYHYQAVGLVRKNAMVDGAPLTHAKEDLTYEYEANVVIKAVNRFGNPSKEEHKVIRLSTVEAGKVKTPVKVGATIVAENRLRQKQAFLVDGKAVTGKLYDLLEAAITVEDDDAIDGVGVIAAAGRLQIGQRWKPNLRLLLAGLRRTTGFRKAKLWPTPAAGSSWWAEKRCRAWTACVS